MVVARGELDEVTRKALDQFNGKAPRWGDAVPQRQTVENACSATPEF